jgi:hypothetical protein
MEPSGPPEWECIERFEFPGVNGKKVPRGPPEWERMESLKLNNKQG